MSIYILLIFIGLIEFGLKESACYSPHRQLSPTLKFRQVESDADGFLEISYHEDANCQISMSHPRPPSRTMSVTSEPENQTILRDENHVQELADLLSRNGNDTEALPLSSKTLLKESEDSVKRENQSLDCDLNSTSDCRNQINGVTLNMVKDEEICNNNQSQDKFLQPISDSCHKSPKSDPFTEKLSGNDSCFSSPLQNKTSVLDESESSSDALKRSISIEDLDSPESISKIDREDCFSLEGVFLQINHDRDSKCDSEKPDRSLCLSLDSSDSAGQAVQSTTPSTYSIPEMNTKSDPVLRTTLAANVDSSVMVYDDFSQDWEAVSNASNNSTKSVSCSPGFPTSPNHSAGSMKIKGSQGVKPTLDKPNSLDLPDTVSTTLQQDGYGLPLAIFSKVFISNYYYSLYQTGYFHFNLFIFYGVGHSKTKLNHLCIYPTFHHWQDVTKVQFLNGVKLV